MGFQGRMRKDLEDGVVVTHQGHAIEEVEHNVVELLSIGVRRVGDQDVAREMFPFARLQVFFDQARQEGQERVEQNPRLQM